MLDFGWVVGLIILGGGCCFLPSCLVFWRKQWQLRTRGVIVQGQVVERHAERGSRGQPWYTLMCRYGYQGQAYSLAMPVWRNLYEKSGACVSLRCLPSNPEVAMVVGDDFLCTEWGQGTFMVVLFCVIGGGVTLGNLLWIVGLR